MSTADRDDLARMKRYHLGNGVYVRFDGKYVILRTLEGVQIHFDGERFSALQNYVNGLQMPEAACTQT